MGYKQSPACIKCCNGKHDLFRAVSQKPLLPLFEEAHGKAHNARSQALRLSVVISKNMGPRLTRGIAIITLTLRA